ncbi:glutathione S-transferase family protein [Denitrobaculum tricleocarpae]|uniref:glutathione S-transferase family protein n=1 Tax=Denitrobaculum tricleocarpae TaxID=2591009 RepID=UPI001C5521ED|nr:glutathione S-transferase family protein [Denitrobaculum tricleocarpae]
METARADTPHCYEAVDILQPRSERSAFFRENARYDEVPLVIYRGKPLVQSNAILLHLAEKLQLLQGGTDKDGPERAQVAEWLMWEQSRLGFSLPNLRFERKFRTGCDPAVLAWLEARLRGDLDVLNNHLGQSTGGFIVGNSLSIADCSLAGYLYWLSDAGLKIADWPAVEAWLTRLSELEHWQHPDDLMRA